MMTTTRSKQGTAARQYRSNFDTAETIKSAVSMSKAVSVYGFSVNHSGFMPCPFHKEKTASLKVYKEAGRGWHCFGCGAGGSVIDFIMRLHGITFTQAIIRLNHDFSLGLTGSAPDASTVAYIARERAREARELETYRTEYRARCHEHCKLWWAVQSGPLSVSNCAAAIFGDKAEAWEDALAWEYAEACARLPMLENWFDNHLWK